MSGTLIISSEKKDYKVYVNGIEKVPPFKMCGIPSGNIRLLVRCTEFTNELETIIPNNGIKLINLDERFKRQ